MNDNTDFNLELSVDPGRAFKKLPDLVAFDLCNAYPIAEGHFLLHNSRSGQRAMVMPEVYSALVSCDQFRTLDEQVNRIIKSSPGMEGQESDIKGVLQSMLDSGMLTSAKQHCDRLIQNVNTAANEADDADSKPVVAIITWERPIALKRLLKSIMHNCDVANFHQLYIIDDSRELKNIEKNRELVANFALSTKKPVQYFGQAEQQSLLKSLSEQLPQHESAIRFLADQSLWREHWTSGLARNIALLLSCGHRLVMLDDDAVCDVYDPEQPETDITFSDQPRQADFFSNEQGWLSRRNSLNPDPVKHHMQCLGLTFSNAVDKLGHGNLKGNGLAGSDAIQINDVHPESLVLTTECGSYGCPGINSNTWLPDMAPTSIQQMLRSPQKTSNALNVRMVWTGRKQPHFAPRPNMSQITGFDNRQTLPPYFPLFRGEDRLFGVLLNFIYPTAVSLDYPWAIPHLPVPKRDWQDKDRDFSISNTFPSFYSEQILDLKHSCHADSPETRLQSLSAYFSDLSASSVRTLERLEQDSVLRSLSGQLRHLNTLSSEADTAPAEWQEYLQNGIEQLNSSLNQASLPINMLKGLPASLEGADLITFWKESWAGFAAALQAWPEIRLAARNHLISKT